MRLSWTRPTKINFPDGALKIMVFVNIDSFPF